jgi:hypothetical protein
MERHNLSSAAWLGIKPNNEFKRGLKDAKRPLADRVEWPVYTDSGHWNKFMFIKLEVKNASSC